ncbi:Phosphatidylserine synthase [Phytophthora cinnamomi]|uniref:Phosphatidylserine synthase n=1 Tax=Phytophthora cinnamomi TaxID=4785 RepID=UPI003559C413|nr:Phosphatidylserine synthase [Phytophthora cinnamomi]
MKIQAALAGLIGLASTTLADPSWHDLAITAPRCGRYLTRTTSGEPFFWQADTAWELTHKLNKTSIDFYLKTRAEQGYNVVQTVVIAELNGTTRANFYGDLPYNNSDTTQPNDAYFQLIDWTVDLAASYGILVALVPVWGRWVNGGWHNDEASIFNESTAYEWGKYIGDRYPGLPKILGGDSDCIWARNTSEAMVSYAADPNVDPATLLGPLEDTTDIWVSMRTGVKDAETAQGYEPVILFHPTAGWISRPENTPEAYGHLMLPKEEDRVSINGVQSGHATPDALGGFTPYTTWDSTKNYELIAKMRDEFTGPVLDLENHYEGAHDNFKTAFPIWNASQVRTGLYHGVYGGATGFTYGANSVWQMYEPKADLLRESDYYSPSASQNASGSWRQDIFFEGATQIQYITKPLQNFSSEELELLEPARQLLASPSGYLDVSVNAFEGIRYISVLASENRDRYFVYTGHGDSFSLKLGNGSERSGSARWFSPRDGQYYANATVSVLGNGNGTRVDFTPPSGGSVDDDWLLVLEF